ncbi:SDR family oxidoreductase [Arthrobacter sp. M4]|uniref:SDR family oxidoreductase n=1 Tax=Arthrobacter sp. M4 TaxID=218160 RepID=UPI001CDBC2A7|nr:SDR family oxidoreductase [Arthrobacter sp. M4]MCA4132538.1 SDR family oxidoreductase [Arthrobacter sp. M4]
MSVLVTGAAGAIGSACVDAFASHGIEVLAQDLDASSLEGREGVTPISGNLQDPGVLARIGELAEQTRLTAVVVAHGIAGSSALPDCTEEFTDRVLRINWSTIPALFDAVETTLTRNQGKYIAVASQAALGGESENIVYCASKFAINGWIQAKQDLGGPISFHSICPGATNSPLLMKAQKQFAAAAGQTPEEYYTQRAKPISLGRYGEPREMGAAAYYLSQPGPKPTILPVTGGDVLL